MLTKWRNPRFAVKRGFQILPVKVLKTVEIARFSLLQRLGNCHGHGDGSADHGVVAHAQKAHHLDVSRDGGGTCELGVGVHTAHGIGHAVGSGTGCHVVRMQGATRAAARGH